MRSKGGDGASHANSWEKKIPGRGTEETVSVESLRQKGVGEP